MSIDRRLGSAPRGALPLAVAIVVATLAAGALAPGLPSVPTAMSPPDDVVWIAHRGGVRSVGAPDNSLPALEAAIRRGYDGVEIDVRETADGVPVAHHDPGLERYFAAACEAEGFRVCRGDYVGCRIEAASDGTARCHLGDLDWSSVRRLVADDGVSRVPRLAELLERVANTELAVMLDFKQRLSPAALAEVERLIELHAADRTVYLIGATLPKRTLARRGLGKFGTVRALHPLVVLVGGVDPWQTFLFQSAGVTERPAVDYARLLGLDLVVSLNWSDVGDPDREGPDLLVRRAHVELERLLELGVRTFQIEDAFDAPFVGGTASR